MQQDPVSYAEVDEASFEIGDVRPARPSVRKIVGAGVLSSLLFAGAGFAAGHGVFHKPSVTEISSQDNMQELAAVESGQWAWQIVDKERDLCSTTKDNCVSSKCCKVAGYHCFSKTATEAKCMKTCKPGKDGECKPLGSGIVLEASKPARSLYCFSVCTINSGSPKPSTEKALLTGQLARKVSIFQCDGYDVFSDEKVSLGTDSQGKEVITTQVKDVDNEFHFAKRKTSGAWVNTGTFIQVWKAIDKSQKYQNYEWVVKVDADAVFVADRLRDRIQWMPRTVGGSMLQNCRYVDYGFFGSLEVYSHMAFSIILANLETCRATIAWKKGIKNGKYGPMGEDLFAEICAAKNGVDKIEAFDISSDGACPADRPKDQKKNKKWQPDCNRNTPAIHPFKKPAAYFKCLEQTMKFQ
jgi:hypothetical protein